MLFDLASDIHVVNWDDWIDSVDWSKEKNSDSNVLVLAGDTSNGLRDTTEVVTRAASVYDHVIFTDGNHEHYGWHKDVASLEFEFAKLAQELGNVTYLNGSSYTIIDDVVFVGACGWYDFKAREPLVSFTDAKEAWREKINDSEVIDFGTNSPNGFANLHSTLIRMTITNLKAKGYEKFVVVTHTTPRNEFVGLDSRYNDPELDGAYCNTSMSSVIDEHGDVIKVWCFGHTHVRIDKTINGIRYVCNPRGYQKDVDYMGKWFIPQINSDDLGYC